MLKEIYGVKFQDDERRIRAVEKSIESVMIEGFKPTKQSVQDIKNLLSGNLTVQALAKKHRDKSNNVEVML